MSAVLLANYFTINDTHREKLCFTRFGTRITAWLLQLVQSVKFYTSFYHVLNNTDV